VLFTRPVAETGGIEINRKRTLHSTQMFYDILQACNPLNARGFSDERPCICQPQRPRKQLKKWDGGCAPSGGYGEGTCHLPSYGVQGISALENFLKNMGASIMQLGAFLHKTKSTHFKHHHSNFHWSHTTIRYVVKIKVNYVPTDAKHQTCQREHKPMLKRMSNTHSVAQCNKKYATRCLI